MAKSLIDDLVDDISGRAGGALDAMGSVVEQDSRHVLLRRFKRAYPTLSVEEVVAIRDTLGHTAGESKPCKSCRIMATSEFRLAQEQD